MPSSSSCRTCFCNVNLDGARAWHATSWRRVLAWHCLFYNTSTHHPLPLFPATHPPCPTVVSHPAVTATDKVVLAVTYATGIGGNFRQGSSTFNIDAACYKATCGGNPPAPSPSPKQTSPLPGSSPALSPSPTPNTCSTLPNVTGITWPVTCSGKAVCQGPCRAGYTGGRVRAVCTQARGWKVTGVCTCVSKACGANPIWGHWGGDLQNTRNAANEKGISPANAARLGQAWVFNTTGDVSATPTVVGSRLLVPDWGGYMYCINADTGGLRRCTCVGLLLYSVQLLL
jgi:hypothetical protein